MLGLFAFFYALLHFMTYFWFDQWFDVHAIYRDVFKRPFITVGFGAFVLLIPLAATSFQAAVRRLGRRWQMLHRAILRDRGARDPAFLVDEGRQARPRTAEIYAVIVAVLLGFRLVWTVLARRKAAARAS